jgi:oligoendopeptidase F
MTDLSRRGLMTAASAIAALAFVDQARAQAVAAATAEPGPGWDLTDLYPDAAAWTAEQKAVLAALPSLLAYKGKLGSDAATLKAALIAASDLDRRVARLYVYAKLKADEDVRISINQERQQLSVDLASAAGEAVAWTSPELLAIGKAKIDGFVASDPSGFARFKFGLYDILRQEAHTLSAEGEALLASAGPVIRGPLDIRGQLNSSDIPWPEVTLSTGEKVVVDNQGYTKARGGPVRADRKLVMDQTFSTYKKYESSLGATLTAKIKGDIFQAKSRKYDNSLQWSVSNYNVPEGVYRTLVAETNKGLPVLHRYFALRQKMLGLPDMRYYDIYPPLVASDNKFTLTQMRDQALKALAPLGPDYLKLFAASTAAKWMDPFPRRGKTGGAYNFGAAYDVHPYLLLNLSDDYESASTYVHEWGHAMHSVLAKQNQPYDTAGTPTFSAEIASTCNEQLLINYMLKNAKTKEDKLYYLGQQMENFRGTFFRQAMFAEFELSAHEMGESGQGASGEKYTALYMSLLKKYHGPGMTIDETYGVEWAYIPHFLNYNFYVYQYATSMTASVYFADKLLGGKVADRDRYLTMLKGGSSDYAYNLLKTAGLDLATPEPYQVLVANFSKTLDDAEKLLA